MTWDDIFTIFKREFVPMVEVQWLAREYLVLEQTIATMVVITAKFRESVLFCPQYAATKDDEDDLLSIYVEGRDSRVREYY